MTFYVSSTRLQREGGWVPLFIVVSFSFVPAMGYWCSGCSWILRGTTTLVSISFGCRPGLFGTIHHGLHTLKCVVLLFWIWVICSCSVGLVTEFTWTAVTLGTDWMNTDSQCETPEQDSFMSLISEPTAGTLDGDISFDMQNGVIFNANFCNWCPGAKFSSWLFEWTWCRGHGGLRCFTVGSGWCRCTKLRRCSFTVRLQ